MKYSPINISKTCTNIVEKPKPKKGTIKSIKMKSALLNGKEILLLIDPKDIPNLKFHLKSNKNIAIYFPPEIDELHRIQPNNKEIQFINETKRVFKGWLVPLHNHHKYIIKED